MGVTRLKREGRYNKTVSRLKVQAVKLLTATAVIKKVDVEELKQQFAK